MDITKDTPVADAIAGGRRTVVALAQKVFPKAETLPGMRNLTVYTNDEIVTLIEASRSGYLDFNALLREDENSGVVLAPDRMKVLAFLAKIKDGTVGPNDMALLDLPSSQFNAICPGLSGGGAPTAPSEPVPQVATQTPTEDEEFLNRRSQFIVNRLAEIPPDRLKNLLDLEKSGKGRPVVIEAIEALLRPALTLVPKETPPPEEKEEAKDENPEDGSSPVEYILDKVSGLFRTLDQRVLSAMNELETGISNEHRAQKDEIVLLQQGVSKLYDRQDTLLGALNGILWYLDPQADPVAFGGEAPTRIEPAPKATEKIPPPAVREVVVKEAAPSVTAPADAGKPITSNTVAVEVTREQIEQMSLEELWDLGDQLGIPDIRKKNYITGVRRAIMRRIGLLAE